MTKRVWTTDEIITKALLDTVLVTNANGESADDLTKLAVKDQSGAGSFATQIKVTETLTADRILTLTLNDADRTLNLGGNLTTTGNITFTGAFALAVTLTAGTTLTLPSGADVLVGRDSTDTLTNKTLTAPAIVGGSAIELTTFSLRSLGGNDLIISTSAAYGADRTLTVNIPTGANAGITLVGSLATAGGAFDLTLTMTGATNVTLPTSGTLITNAVTILASLVSVGTLTTGTWNASVITAPYGGTGLATLTDGGILLGSGVGAVTCLGQATNGQLPIGSTGTDPILAALTATANQTKVTNAAGSITLGLADDILVATTLTIPNTGLHVLDTNASHDLIIKPGSDITADRTLTITTGDADRTLTISGNATISQDYSSAGSPTLTGLTLSGLTASKPVFTDAGKALVSTGTLAADQGGTGVASPTAHSLIVAEGAAAMVALGVATNGQLPIGSTGADPVLAALTGTANQITVTNAAGSITLSAPQNLHSAATPTFGGGTFAGDTEVKVLNLTDQTELTIAAGVITVTQSYHNVDTEADAATDDLDTINGGLQGDILIICPNIATRTIVAKHGTGNLNLASGADFTMDEDDDYLVLLYNGSLWQQIGRSENHA